MSRPLKHHSESLCKASAVFISHSVQRPQRAAAPEVARVGHVLGLLGLAEHALVAAQGGDERAGEGQQRGGLRRARIIAQRQEAFQALVRRGEQLQVCALRCAPMVHLGSNERCDWGVGVLERCNRSSGITQITQEQDCK